MIYWAQLFHFYQPATQIPSVLDKICDESYRPLLEVFNDYPNARATVNINGILTEMLHYCGHGDIIEGLKKLAERGQTEFTGSGKYHPILPLIPPDEIKRQLELNQRANTFFFGDVYKPRGFFPPEMAYGQSLLPPVTEAGYQWIILSGIACPASWPVETIYRTEHSGRDIAVFFRDDLISNRISFQKYGPKEFLDNLNSLKGNKENIYVVTAMDAETYGHHIKNWENLFLAEVYEQIHVSRESYAHIQQKKALAPQHASILHDTEVTQNIQTATISELMNLFPQDKQTEPRASSWSAMEQDLKRDNPYPLWADKKSEIHRLQWEHIKICLEMCYRATQIADTEESKNSAGLARGLMDRALQSDQFWWASRRPMWDINLIYMGFIDQSKVILNACRAASTSETSDKIKAEFYNKLTAARSLQDQIIDLLFIP